MSDEKWPSEMTWEEIFEALDRGEDPEWLLPMSFQKGHVWCSRKFIEEHRDEMIAIHLRKLPDGPGSN